MSKALSLPRSTVKSMGYKGRYVSKETCRNNILCINFIYFYYWDFFVPLKLQLLILSADSNVFLSFCLTILSFSHNPLSYKIVITAAGFASLNSQRMAEFHVQKNQEIFRNKCHGGRKFNRKWGGRQKNWAYGSIISGCTSDKTADSWLCIGPCHPLIYWVILTSPVCLGLIKCTALYSEMSQLICLLQELTLFQSSEKGFMSPR